jgi:hypothetical protein
LNKERKIEKHTAPQSDGYEGVKFEVEHGRRFLRLPFATPTELRYLNGDPAARTFILSARNPGMLLNLGAGGSLILSEHAPQPGELLTLDLHLSDAFQFGGILGKIKRVEPCDDGGFLVGIEFGTLLTLDADRASWQLPPGVVRFDSAFREALHHMLFTMEVQRRECNSRKIHSE